MRLSTEAQLNQILDITFLQEFWCTGAALTIRFGVIKHSILARNSTDNLRIQNNHKEHVLKASKEG